jgi:hypothetical protein
MRRLSVRRSASVGETVGLAAVGLGLGFLAGFLARGWFGEVGGTRFRRFMDDVAGGPGAPVSGRAAADRVLEALRRDPEFAELTLDALPVRGGRVELHGWAPDRRVRARAARAAGAAVPGLEVTNRIRVRGEDDVPMTTAEPEGEERLPA